MKHRTLTREEKALWAHVQRSVAPFPGRVIDDVAIETPAERKTTVSPPSPRAAPPRQSASSAPAPLTAMDRRTLRRVKRGSVDIGGALDLHGLTQASAHDALRSFLSRKQRDGHAIVIIITGKGAMAGYDGDADRERGVLKRMVPHWLRLPDLRPLILGFEQAAPHHGGDGALYVRLRRSRAYAEPFG